MTESCSACEKTMKGPEGFRKQHHALIASLEKDRDSLRERATVLEAALRAAAPWVGVEWIGTKGHLDEGMLCPDEIYEQVLEALGESKP